MNMQTPVCVLYSFTHAYTQNFHSYIFAKDSVTNKKPNKNTSCLLKDGTSIMSITITIIIIIIATVSLLLHMSV